MLTKSEHKYNLPAWFKMLHSIKDSVSWNLKGPSRKTRFTWKLDWMFINRLTECWNCPASNFFHFSHSHGHESNFRCITTKEYVPLFALGRFFITYSTPPWCLPTQLLYIKVITHHRWKNFCVDLKSFECFSSFVVAYRGQPAPKSIPGGNQRWGIVRSAKRCRHCILGLICPTNSKPESRNGRSIRFYSCRGEGLRVKF